MEDITPTISNHDLAPISIERLKERQKVIHQAMKQIMVKDVHYGVIPGTPKPTLYKAGAEIIANLFQLVPTYVITRTALPNSHREVEVITTLKCGNSIVGQGVGSCSTMEKKYRWRSAAKKCPICGNETIIKGKKDYGGGWLCFAKKGGCGAKFSDGDPLIDNQAVGQIENPDIADEYNNILKIGKKRSYVDSVITATAASDIFNQDLEDFDLDDREVDPRPGTFEVIEKVIAKTPSVAEQTPLPWDEYKYRYHLPTKKAGWNMQQVRDSIKAKGFRFNEYDSHWYGSVELVQLKDYLRPLNIEDLTPTGSIEITDADINAASLPNL